MPLEIYGYTVLSIKTALLRGNVLYNNVQKQNVAYSYTCHVTRVPVCHILVLYSSLR